MSFTNFQNVHTIITTDSMNVSGRTVHTSFFLGLVCVRLWVHKHLNGTNNVIRTLCSNYTNTCSQIWRQHRQLRANWKVLPRNYTLIWAQHTRCSFAFKFLRLCVCVHVVLTGKSGSLVVSSLFSPPSPAHHVKFSSMTRLTDVTSFHYSKAYHLRRFLF